MTDNLYTSIRDRVVAVLADLVPGLEPALLARVEVTPTRDPAHGDMATNAALVAAKPARRPPAAIAAELAVRLAALPELAGAEAAGPGFVNLRLRPDTLRGIIPVILRAGVAFGSAVAGEGVRVNVEYVSANPTGPLHVGHCRGAVVGDALANLLAKAGYEVTTEFYVNDAGNQVAALAWAVYWRYLQALGSSMTEEAYAAQVPGGLQYRGDYLLPIAADLVALHGDTYAGPGLTVAHPAGWLALFRDHAMATLLAEIKLDLARLGVHQRVFTSERAILAAGAADRAIILLDSKGLIYQGVLEPPKGKTPDDWEPRRQTLFAATRFGDDVDRPLRKSDGANTYFANDIGYHDDKLRRGFDVLIDVLGADHGGYVSRMRAAVAALSNNKVEFDVVLCQIVHVLRAGKPVRMSKRAGTYVTLADLLDEVGPDAVRFTMLMRKSDAQMEFDIDAAIAVARAAGTTVEAADAVDWDAASRRAPSRASSPCCSTRYSGSTCRRKAKPRSPTSSRRSPRRLRNPRRSPGCAWNRRPPTWRRWSCGSRYGRAARTGAWRPFIPTARGWIGGAADQGRRLNIGSRPASRTSIARLLYAGATKASANARIDAAGSSQDRLRAFLAIAGDTPVSTRLGFMATVVSHALLMPASSMTAE